MKPLDLGEVYQVIEPGPVVLLTTRDKAGRANVMTMSWLMPIEFTPPQIACIVSAGNHSFAALRATGECVIAVPTVERAKDVVAIGNCSGRDGDKFARLKLEQTAAREVGAPLLPWCFANLECRVIDTALASKRNLFVLEVVAAWRFPHGRARPRTIHHCGWGTFVVDGDRIKLKSDKA